MTLAEQLETVIGQGQVCENEPMKNHTTFRIGGPADIFVCPKTEEGLIRGLKWCREKKISFYVIGNGSNLLVGDKGFRGVVFQVCKNLDFVETEITPSGICVRAGAGVMLAKLARDVSARGYTGFEFATGIPGTLGGAVTMNAGAYGGEMKQVLVSVRAVNMAGEVLEISLKDLELGYRTSRIQKEALIVLSAVLKFARVMQKPFGTGRGAFKTAEGKQPLEYPSAGSTFKRPEGYFAGKLIQDAGLKGYRVGDAMVSEKHSGFVINAGAATASQVRQLMQDVDAIVYEKFQVHLEPEVRMIGEF